MAEDRRDVGLLAVTSADRLNAGWTAAQRARERGLVHARSHIERLLDGRAAALRARHGARRPSGDARLARRRRTATARARSASSISARPARSPISTATTASTRKASSRRPRRSRRAGRSGICGRWGKPLSPLAGRGRLGKAERVRGRGRARACPLPLTLALRARFAVFAAKPSPRKRGEEISIGVVGGAAAPRPGPLHRPFMMSGQPTERGNGRFSPSRPGSPALSPSQRANGAAALTAASRHMMRVDNRQIENERLFRAVAGSQAGAPPSQRPAAAGGAAFITPDAERGQSITPDRLESASFTMP